MEIQQLRHFLAAVEHGNIDRAATALNITQSGLSRSIKNLETVVGLTLLKRTAKGVEPTTYGLNLVPRAEAILNQARLAREDLDAARVSRGGHVRLGLTRNFSHSLGPEIVADALGSAPDLSLSVTSGPFDILVDQLRTARIDVMFGLLVPRQQERDLIVEELFITRSGIYGRGNHPLAKKKKVEPAELAQQRWGIFDSEGLQREFASFFDRHGLPAPRPIISTNSFSLLKQAMMTLDLLTIMTRSMVETEVKSGRMALIASETPGDHTRTGLVYRHDSPSLPGVQTMMKVIRERVKTWVKP